MRSLLWSLVFCLSPGLLRAQASIVSDLWRVASGTLLVPAALANDGSASLWTPAAALTGDQRFQVGVEAINSPTEVGVTGGILAFSAHTHGLGTINASYGRLGIGNVGYTETSPEIVGSAIDIYSQIMSLGLAGQVAPGLTGGVALRYLSGRLGFESRSQLGLDFGAQFQPNERLRLGATTHFFDPTFGSSQQASSYSLGAEYRTRSLNAWGTPATLALRGGFTAAHGDEQSLLLTSGLVLGPSLLVDAGAAYEHTHADAVWRSRLGVGVATGPFIARVARDGGVNGFGATYRFSLTAVFK